MKKEVIIMEKKPVVSVLIAAVIYAVMFLLGSTCGLIHPACYAYAGTVIPLLFAFVYLYTAARWQGFGAAAILNGVVLVIGLIAGEGNLALVIGLIVLALLAELIRKSNGYDTLTGVRRSFIPLAFSFYAYSAHWWTDTEGSLAAAVAEMPAGYADRMAAVIHNTPMLIIMLVLTVPVAMLGIRLAEKVLKKQAASLK